MTTEPLEESLHSLEAQAIKTADIARRLAEENALPPADAWIDLGMTSRRYTWIGDHIAEVADELIQQPDNDIVIDETGQVVQIGPFVVKQLGHSERRRCVVVEWVDTKESER